MKAERCIPSRSFGQRRTLFDRVFVINDFEPRPAAMNMAIDEALLESGDVASIRFYHWNSPALSFGYFGKFADAVGYATRRDLVRRWTGGGLVFHGEDLTYSLFIPASDPLFRESAMSIYEKTHRALADALVACGQGAVLAAILDPGVGINDAGYNGHCFASPVVADVLVNHRKVAGAAQRRTRRGLLQQGSIQGVVLPNGLETRFTEELSENYAERKIDNETLNRAREIAARKYGTEEWLRRR